MLGASHLVFFLNFHGKQGEEGDPTAGTKNWIRASDNLLAAGTESHLKWDQRGTTRRSAAPCVTRKARRGKTVRSNGPLVSALSRRCNWTQ